MDGVSLLSSLKQCNPDLPRTQYFEMGGKIGLWHDGWFLAMDDGRTPWMYAPPRDWQPKWALYNLNEDYSQSVDLAEKYPEKTAELAALWDEVAKANNVYPLDHRFGFARAMGMTHGPARDTFDLWSVGVSLPTTTGPAFAGRSFTLTAELEPSSPDASGVVVAYGSRFAGWSLYLDQGVAVFTYAASTKPSEIVTVRGGQAVKAGEPLVLRVETAGPRQPATARITSGSDSAEAQIATTFLLPAGLGETLDVGRDLGVDVTDYPHGDTFEGAIPHVHIQLDPPPARGAH